MVSGSSAGMHLCLRNSRSSSLRFGFDALFRALAALAFVLAAAMGAPSAYALDIDGAVTNNFRAWEPTTSSWVSGNATGYAEGDVVALSLELTGSGSGAAAANTQYQVQVCLDYNYSGNNTNYAFIIAAPWNTFNNPTPTLRGGAITSTLDAAATDWGTINTVAYVGQGLCASNSLAYDVTFTTGAAPGPANFYIYFGARVARPGLTTATGATVPAGGGVSTWPTGNFQTSLRRTTGNKTVSFQPSDFEPLTDVCRIVSMNSGTAVTPPGSVLWGSGVLTGTCGTTSCSLTLDTSGIHSNGLIYSDGQYPVDCSGPVAECFPTQSPSPFTTSDATSFNLNGLVLTTNPAGGTITFGAGGTYAYSGSKFAAHSGTYRTTACADYTVPEPGTFPLLLLSLAGLGLVLLHQASRRSRPTSARIH